MQALLSGYMLLLVLLTAILFTLFFYRFSRDQLLQQIDERLLAAAHFAKAALPADFHDRLNQATSLPVADYEQIVDRHNRLCTQLQLQYLWSCMLAGGDIVFTTATSPGKDIRKGDHASFFRAHSDPHAFDRVFGRMEVDYSSFQNEWGHGRMVLVPFRDSHGRPYCFGASMSINDVFAAQRALLLHTLMLGCGALAMGLLGTLLLARLFTRPLRQLTASAERITQGDLAAPVPIAGPAEIAQLAATVDTMRLAITDKLAALQRSEERLDSALLQSHTGGWDLDLATRVAYRTLEHGRIFGYTPPLPPWSFEKFMEHVLPEDRTEVSRLIRLAIETATALHLECRIRRLDGAIRWLWVAGGPQRDAEGRVHRMAGIVQDITDRKEMEAALRISAEEHRLLLQNLSAAVVVHAPDTRIIYSNPMASRLLGLTTEQMQGKQALDPAWHFTHGDGRPMALAAYPVNLVRASGQPLHDYVVGVHHPGRPEVTWVLVNAFPELDDRQQLRQIVVTFVDITAVRQTEAALRENEAVLRSFFDSPGIMRGIVELVEEGDILHISDNTVAAQFFGRTPETMRNQLATALGVPREIVQQWIAHYEASRQSGELVTFTYAHPVGQEEKWFSVMVNFLGLTDQQRARYAYSVRDITDVKRLEAQLVQAQKMEAIGQLAGGVAHDFNNILQAINGYTELAQGDLEPGHPARDSLNEIGKAGTRAAKLVGQLLAFSRRTILEPAHLDLNEVVGNLLGMLERVIGEHIRLDLIPGHHLGTVHADRTMLEQVLLNLCVNARDAMPNGGRLTLETENVTFDSEYCERNPWARPGRYLLLSVTDTGCGMDALTLERIFEPFFSTKGPGKGTGLGLSMVYGIVRQHEGMVRAYSEVGKGTTFKVYLPVVERPADVVGTKIESLPLGGHETILVAEDDASLRELAHATLTRAGYTVLLAANGAEALEVFHRHAAGIKLLLLDVVMPELGGREVFDRIRAGHPHLPALFASGYSENAIHTNFVLQEGMKLIRKPYDTAALLRAVRATLDAAAGAR